MDKLTLAISKAVKNAKSEVQKWEQTCDACQGYLSSLENLSEQLKCCSESKIENTSLGMQFPNVKEELNLKLYQEIDVCLNCMTEKLIILKTCLSNFGKCADKFCRDVKGANPENLKWSATSPSPSDVSLWLFELSHHMNIQVSEKETLLCSVPPLQANADPSKNLNTFVRQWKKHEKLQKYMDEIAEYTSNCT
ncbi:AFG2-interacting ribosome maturation factor-like [Ciona intestinalis]